MHCRFNLITKNLTFKNTSRIHDPFGRLQCTRSALQKRCRQPSTKDAKRELKVNLHNETLPFCSEPKYLGVTLDRSLTYRRHLESLRKKLTSHVAFLKRLAGSGWECWSNNSANGRLSPGAFNCRVLCSCLVSQCSHPAYRPHHQRRFANCHWMPASYTSGQPSNPCRHPTCWASSQTLSIAHRAVQPRHLLHSALTRPSSADARCLKSRHPFVSAAQQLISFSDNNNNNNIRAAHWADHQWNAEWADNPTKLSTSIPDTGTHTYPEWPSQEAPRSDSTASAPVSVVSAPACTNGVWPPLRPVAQNKPPTMSSSTVQFIDPPRTTRPDGSGRWDDETTGSTPAPISRRASSG